jgi:hypothetical protein
MIAMQYSFELPADYDMSIIESRVHDKGHAFDETPGLGVKAFLAARRGDPQTGSQVNVYAPFYIWIEPQAMVDFLCGDKFAGLTGSFGWPSVQSWPLFDVKSSGRLSEARFATRSIEPLRPFDSLHATREAERRAIDDALRHGALLAMSGCDPHTWQRIRFCLWPEQVAPTEAHALRYDVLHISAPHGSHPFRPA